MKGIKWVGITLGTIAVALVGGVFAANLSITILGNTEGAFFFFFLGCVLTGVAAGIVVFHRRGRASAR
jgi:hypothetical protein